VEVEGTGPIAKGRQITSLQQQGFADITIEVNLRWLLRDGYGEMVRDGESWLLEATNP
jgi:hypothetical protein